jgi:hypothetical protein
VRELRREKRERDGNASASADAVANKHQELDALQRRVSALQDELTAERDKVLSVCHSWVCACFCASCRGSEASLLVHV